ncbi:MAG: hypothetical protein M3P47_07065, partial [Pseudomonadota bacterium]|nr:hypothetical protein [Pseudomonadota bacterium]
LAFLQQSRGKRYDPQVLDAFVSLSDSESADKAQKEGALGPNSLRPGMVLSRDLVSREGALLLAADSLLDDSLIKQIRGYTRYEERNVVIHVHSDQIETATNQKSANHLD